MLMHVKNISKPSQIPPQAQKVYKGGLSPWAETVCDLIRGITGVDVREMKAIQ